MNIVVEIRRISNVHVPYPRAVRFVHILFALVTPILFALPYLSQLPQRCRTFSIMRIQLLYCTPAVAGRTMLGDVSLTRRIPT